MPPELRNHRDPTGSDTPTAAAASSLDLPAAIALQKPTKSSRIATGGRPGDDSFFRPARSERLFPAIATSIRSVLRRPVETAQYAAQVYRDRLTGAGLVGSMGRRGNPYDNAMPESLMKTLKVEGVYPMASEAQEDVAEQLPRFIEKYNDWRLHSALGCRSPNQFEEENARTPVKTAA
jgi:transposase InsO family protein